ncbi:hypothetical protein PFICI_06562 [Pestalotiopsis fici W106-1]|uniref:Enoyl reductase (ER) domain-containing protein n=1 Tax=Pestalotiopsis fici (strain W106-1 / CGMCC3.15140) TaxID=1229662 RepID=W3X687_PESFW|nr:uncharacterized protein PFICI_06562 [Pestalotiopsis fici W106-1]ETS81560.1 hypothetical protein PFICI_06562 [Pestalotiopsis fici W106-1]
MSIQQYQTDKQGGTFSLVTVPKPTPGPNEICIRPKTVSVNPIDWKNIQFGAMVKSWPAVLGIDGAGIVESVGSDVRAFKAGDEVMSFANGIFGNGSFAEIYTVPENLVAKKPQGLSWEEAASLPITYLTAASAIYVGLKIQLPRLTQLPDSNQPKSILVLGGSSTVGSAAIQLLRLALPFTHITTTSSSPHHAHLQSLGASACLERSSQDHAEELKASTPDGHGFDAIIDAVGAGGSSPAVYEALKAAGPRRCATVITGPPAGFPEGVDGALVGGQDFLDAEIEAMPYLTKLVEEGRYQLPVKVDVVGQGWQAIDAAIARYPKGVSGAKMVVTL